MKLYLIQVFFPVILYKHFYLMVFNRDTMKIDIIDSLPLPKGQNLYARYGPLLDDLVSLDYMSYVTLIIIDNMNNLQQYE